MSTTAAAPWRFDVAGHPPGPNDRLSGPERWRRCRPFKESIGWQARTVGLPPPLERAHVVALLVYDRLPFKDIDNATAALKPCLDGLIAGGLLIDDAPAHLSLTVRQEIGQRRAVRLEVWPGAGPTGAQEV
jgi:hypothetical protein